MNTPGQSKVLMLSKPTTDNLTKALKGLALLIPDIELLQECDGECQEISQMAGMLQGKITKYLHAFGHRKT